MCARKVWLFDFCEVLACVPACRQTGRAKGNVSNVGRIIVFLSCGSSKKLNLFSFMSFFFILKPYSQSFSVSLSFLRLVGND